MARSGIIFGDSGTWKSTAGKHFSHYVYERSGKKTLLLSTDGGGWGPMQPEVDAGIIAPYRCNTQVPLPLLRKISQGYWPRDAEESDYTKIVLRAMDFLQFGGLIVEGVTSISQALMRYLADNAIKTGEDATNAFGLEVMVDNGAAGDKKVRETFAGSSRGHYNFVQNQLYSLIMNFNSLPLEYVLYTGLESRAEEDDRTPVYGPQIAGKKATGLIPSWVGDCIHAQGIQVQKSVTVPDPADPKKQMQTTIVEMVVRMYFISHPDPVTQIRYPAKPRVTPEAIPALMKEYPGGYFEPGLEEGFDRYLHTVDRLNQGQKNAVDEWRRKVDARFKQQREGAAAATATAVTTK